MVQNPIRSVLVVGGGSAGWMAAAALANAFRDGVSIQLVESDEIGTVGVGEATIPPIKVFNRQLGLNEPEFVKATGGSFKLGIEFVNWARMGHRFAHPFGSIGYDFDLVPFDQHWIRLHLEGAAPRLEDLSITWAAATRGKFARIPKVPRDARAPKRPRFDYAYHFDAGLYAAHLRRHSEALGVTRHEGKIVDVKRAGKNGLVKSVKLEDGRELEADLFIDCSGFRALLIEGTMKSKFEDWSHWLPCDRAFAVPSERSPSGITPFTRSTAHEAGWQWRIPLQHRTGNGHVFVSALMSEERAAEILLENIDAPALAEPRMLKFKAGRRTPWVGNVVALGLSAGFLEPLESTSIHLVQSSIRRLLQLFPTRDFDPRTIGEFNRQTRMEWDAVRDFIVLHYCANERTDSELWRQCASMELPTSLKDRIDYFRSTGRIIVDPDELFKHHSWFSVLIGQFVEPATYNPIVDSRPRSNSRKRIEAMAQLLARIAENMPRQDEFIDRNCRSHLEVERAARSAA